MTSELEQWLDSLETDDLRELVLDLISSVPGAGERTMINMLRSAPNTDSLLDEVNAVLTPDRRFYDYREANAYASEIQDVVQLLVDAAEHPEPPLIKTIERALTLSVRTILRSDDSSGAQGDQIYQLMDAHARAVAGSAAALTAKEKRRIADWIYKFRYDGKQDFFDPDIVSYAEALGPDAVQRYRSLIEKTDLGPYGRHPLIRLAVLDRDARAIVAAHGGEPTHIMLAERLVESLDEAGLQSDALRYAQLGLEMAPISQRELLADFVVKHLVAEGDVDGALTLRRRRLHSHPSSVTFHALRETAIQQQRWDIEREAAETVLKSGSPHAYLSYLMEERRDDEAWHFAHADPNATQWAGTWATLCERRAATHPSETLPVYRELVETTLQQAKRSNYHSAAGLLKQMRNAAKAAGDPAAFTEFLAEVLEANRRRPACLDIFRRAGLR